MGPVSSSAEVHCTTILPCETKNFQGCVILVILDAEIVYCICKLGTNVGRKD